MNKPFTLEEYKKNPSRLRHVHHGIAWHVLLPDGSIAMKPTDGGVPFINDPEMCRSYFQLATEYEVRRARPSKNVWGEVTLRQSPYEGCPTWCGPEFEYKVEKP